MQATETPIRARVWACMVLALWCLCMIGTPALAQTLSRPDPDQPVALVADRIDFDADAGRVVATGAVEVYYGERTLTADRIVYDDRTGRISADGNIVLRDPTGTTVFADAADLDAELRDGLVEGARSVMGEHIRLAAVEARRVDERYNTLSKAVYSPCKVCAEDPTPLWRIRARRVIHDEQERIIHYENATFDVFGVPIAWLPYFRHPDPSVKRASGFLTPSFLSSSTFGYGFKLPYFFVIDDHSDLTFTPFFTSNDGLILQGEYRRAFENGGFELAGSVTYNDFDGRDRIRGHVDSHGNFLTYDDFEWGWDINFTSDDGYLRRYSLDFADRLTSEIYIRRYSNQGYFDGSGVYFQSLRDNEPAGDIPRALPTVDARYDFQEPLLDGELGLFWSGHVLTRNNGRDATRLTLGLDWEREVITSWGLSLTGFAEGRADFFSAFDDPTINNDLTSRITGHIGVEARMPWVWTPDDGATHVIEPVIQLIAAPYGGNGADIPFEDSLVTEFDETNVIDRNHFSGLDNFEEGPRANLALRYERIVSDGLRFDASVGRVYRLRRQRAFSAGSGLAESESDFVGAWSASYDPYVTLRHRIRLSNDADITRNEFFGAFKIDPVELNVNYAFFESDPAVGALLDREEVTAETIIGIDDNWSVSAFMQRDLQLGEFVRIGGQITYQNECCAVDLFLNRRFTDSTDAPASTSVGVRIKLLTLGEPDGQ